MTVGSCRYHAAKQPANRRLSGSAWRQQCLEELGIDFVKDIQKVCFFFGGGDSVFRFYILKASNPHLMVSPASAPWPRLWILHGTWMAVLKFMSDAI